MAYQHALNTCTYIYTQVGVHLPIYLHIHHTFSAHLPAHLPLRFHTFIHTSTSPRLLTCKHTSLNTYKSPHIPYPQTCKHIYTTHRPSLSIHLHIRTHAHKPMHTPSCEYHTHRHMCILIHTPVYSFIHHYTHITPASLGVYTFSPAHFLALRGVGWPHCLG